MGIIAKGADCDVDGCDQKGIRSITTARVEKAGLLVSGSNKKTALCREHYKEYKKETKTDRDLERARWS